LIAVHAVHLNAVEIGHLATAGCSVVHCPTSNMKLASGIAPVTQLLASGVRVALGTDGAASNNRLDILREARQAALLAKVASGDAAVLAAHQALRMATLDGAAALGLESAIGSLAPGKWADLCSIRLDDWQCQPCYDPASHLLYVAGREQVSSVWVAGQARIRNGQIQDLINLTVSKLFTIGKPWHNCTGLPV
jgi:5-methylthioadenosine/S-adenosylhomocysteine deaminase